MLCRDAMGIAAAWGANECIAKAALAISAALAGLHIAAMVAIWAAAIDVRFHSILDTIRAHGRNARVRPARGIAHVSGHCTIRIDVAFDALSYYCSGGVGADRTAILRTRSGYRGAYVFATAARVCGAIIEVICRIVVVHDLGIACAIANLKLAVTDELAGVRWRAVQDRRRAANAHITRGHEAFIHGIGTLRWIHACRASLSSGASGAPLTARATLSPLSRFAALSSGATLHPADAWDVACGSSNQQ